MRSQVRILSPRLTRQNLVVLHALTRGISDLFNDCELTYEERVLIDLEVARAQHRAYEEALIGLGVTVAHIPAGPWMPDCVFVEDTAVVLDEIAVITRPGAQSRREETSAVEFALSRYRAIAQIKPPAQLDGGDVLVLGKKVYVGYSGRTNRVGVAQLEALLRPCDYDVVGVPFAGCLHLKSAITRASDQHLLVNRRWVDGELFPGWRFIEIDPDEPNAANICLPNGCIYPDHFPKTESRLREAGIPLVLVPASEVAKAEGAVTCCSIIFNRAQGTALG